MRVADAVVGTAVLSERQMEVLQLLAAGQTAENAGRILGISASTVARHKQAAFRKLGVQSQAQAVAMAIRTGQLTTS